MRSFFNIKSSNSGGSKKTEKELEIGDVAPDFKLCDVEGKKYTLSSFRGRRVLLSFFRYAACPICQYSLDRMKQQSRILTEAGIVVVCIFNSNPEMIAKLVSSRLNESENVITLSDKKGSAYSLFQLKKGSSMNESNFVVFANWHKYGRHMKMINILKDSGNKPSHLKQLPADFMIDENGVIVDLFRAETVQDHMPFERIEAFIPENKRCNCCTKHCISARCRHEHEERMKEAAEGIFMG